MILGIPSDREKGPNRMGCDTDTEGIHVSPSGDPERPVAVRLTDDGPLEKLARSDAWRLWSLLQAELVRTLPNPPTHPQATPQ